MTFGVWRLRSMVVCVLALASLASAQPVRPTGSSTVLSEPAWSRTVRLADGRIFVTDGGLALDVVVAKPKAMPPDIQGDQAAKALAGHVALVNPTDVGLADLTSGAKKNEFVAPNGSTLNGNYVSFLRRAAPTSRLRLKGLLDPIVVVLDGKVIGVFMPIKPETRATRPR
jgi:hypothetical protein